MDLAISTIPELAQQTVIKNMYEARKMRTQILERFAELSQRIKTEMKVDFS
jgi:hypothetical protein